MSKPTKKAVDHEAERRLRLKEDASKAALLACELLVSAYKRGEKDEQMDWNDVDQAHLQALHALSLSKRKP